MPKFLRGPSDPFLREPSVSARRAATAAIERFSVSRIGLHSERALDNLMTRPRDGHGERFSLLVTTVGLNIGDQAMFDSFMQNTLGPVVAVVPGDDRFYVERVDRDRVKLISLPEVTQGDVLRRRRTLRLFSSLLAQATDLSIIGADIMDGSYSRRESMLRLNMLRMSRRFGVPARVLGFSWSNHFDEQVVAELRRVSRSDLVRLIARDRISSGRLETHGVRHVLGADLAFSRSGSESYKPFDLWRSGRSRPFVAVNASGLSSTPALVEHYRDLVRALREREHEVIMLPHVIRIGDDDLSVAKKIVSGEQHENLFVVEDLLRPSQVAHIAAQARLVVTGRMHLGVIALASGTPAVVIDSHDKARGLLEDFGTQHLCVGREACSQLLPTSIQAMEEADSLRQTIADHLPAVREASRLNFSKADSRRAPSASGRGAT